MCNAKESSVAPQISIDVVQAAPDDLQHLESPYASSLQTGQKLEQPQHQQPGRPKIQESDKRPKKRAKKSDVAPSTNWDSDQSSQVRAHLGCAAALCAAIGAFLLKTVINTHQLAMLQMEFELPLRLKQILLGEYESISRNDHLPPLPYKPCVADILSQYVDQSNSEGLDFEEEASALHLHL